jgi:IS1 family transposase
MPARLYQLRSKRTTPHIARCTNTLRHRAARLGRAALSCSKKLSHHSGAMKLFLCHYNLTRAAA